MQDYRKLKVWKSSHELTLAVYQITKSFPREETYGLTSQIRRAAMSIPANIAEGCGKKTQEDFSRYLTIALGSLHETEYYTLLSWELGYLPQKQEYQKICKDVEFLKVMLIRLISVVKKP